VDEDCSAAVDNSRCSDVNMTCVCDVIAGYQWAEDGTCYIRKSFLSYTMRVISRQHFTGEKPTRGSCVDRPSL